MALIKVGQIPEINFSEYDDLMSYPHWFESINSDLSTQGMPLRDAISCQVNWNANQFPTLQMTYPRTGIHQDKLKENTYLMADVTPKFPHQLFKITHIQQELDNVVVNANHIASLLNDATVSDPIQFTQATAQDLMNQILNVMQPQKDFTFDSDVWNTSQVNIEAGQQAGALLIDPDQEGDTATQSVLGLFGGELEFDNFNIHHTKQAGNDTGITVTYGRNIQSITQDRNIENMYTGAVFVATYTPGQAVATKDNVNWSSWETEYSSIGVTYMAGGSPSIYDCPVEGQTEIRKISDGQKLHLGTPVADGAFTPDKKYQINTVNGDTWYPISPEDGGGWIDAQWINFDSTGTFSVNDIKGDVTVKSESPMESSGKGTRVVATGYAVVAYKKGGSIHVYHSPEIGAEHYRIPGKTIKNGTRIHYDMIERNQYGDLWYRLYHKKSEWVYGPHLSTTEEGAYRTFEQSSTNAYGYIKKGAQTYHLNKKGEMVGNTKTIDAHGKTKHKFRYKKSGKKKLRRKNGAYYDLKKKKVKVTAKKGMTTIDKTIQQGGVTYMHTKHGWVKSSFIDYHKDGSVKPQSFDKWLEGQIKDRSKVEIYKTPNSHDALNWSIPNGEHLTVEGHEAKAGDGKTYIEVTYKGKTGWLCEDNIDDDKSHLQSPDADTDSDSDTDTNSSANVDQSQKEVRVVVGPLYADGFGNDANIDKVNTVDVTSYFTHDDQDLSGQQPDGSFKPTQADIDEVTQIGQNYLVEHRYGHIDVSTTLNYQEMSGYDIDWMQLSLYDRMNLYFPQYQIDENTEINGVVWDVLSQHYTSITLGDLPESFAHLLTSAINKKSNEREKKINNHLNTLHSFVGDVNKALKLQGASQQKAWEDMMVSLGDAQYETDPKTGKKKFKTDESIEVFAKHMQEMVNNVSEFDNFLRTGPQAPLHFVGADGTEDFKNPVAVVASDSDHSFALDSNGITYRDAAGNAHGLFGIDTSTGQPVGKFFVDKAYIPVLDASHIQCDTIHTLGMIDGSLKVRSPGGDILTAGLDGTNFGFFVGPYSITSYGSAHLGDIDCDVITPSEVDVGSTSGMMITSDSITRRNQTEHVMWSTSSHTNLGAYIKAHFDSKYYHGI